jgi:VWFA-related protein
MTSLRVVLLALIALTPVLAGQSLPPQRPLPEPQEPVATFRSSVRAIQVDAVVTDEDGNPVRGLTEDDFEIVEKGKPQPITTFEAVDIPIERQPPDLADSDVVTNEGDGRIYLIVLDSISAENGMYAKRILRRFFDEHFGPSDVAAVMMLGTGHRNAGQDFTSNRRLLVKGIDSFIGYSEGDVRFDAAVPGAASPFDNQRCGQPCVLGAVNRMGRLKDLTEFLIRTPGRRKAMILISEAIGFDATDFVDYGGGAMTPAAHLAHAAMTAATRGNIAIYPIHPGGASTEMVISGPEAAVQDAARARRLALQSATLELRTIAAATGGFAVVNTNEFDKNFTRIVAENSVYYMLGFNSSQDKDDGLYVPVEVKVKRPGLRVHAREGYIAPFKGKDTVTRTDRRGGVETALASPVPMPGVPIRAFAAPFRGTGKNAAIAVTLHTEAGALGLHESANGALQGPIDVRLVATDVSAKVLPQSRQAGTITIPANSRAAVERDGLHVLTKTELKPGRYQLRVAVGSQQRGGSVLLDLDVPDFTKKDLAISGLVVRGSEKPAGVFLPKGDPLEALGVRGPTTERLFTNSDAVSVYAEIYEAAGGKPRSIEVNAVLRGEAGQVIPVASATVSSDDLKKTGHMLRVEPQLPLRELKPGRYVFSLEARSSAGGNPVTRSIPLRVR